MPRRWAIAAVVCLTLGACSDASSVGTTREGAKPARKHASHDRDALPDAGEADGAAATDAATSDASEPPSDMNVTCARRDPAIELSTSTNGPVPAGTAVTYTIAIRNQNDPSCPAESFLASVTTPPEDPGFRSKPNSQVTPPLAAGETAELAFAISSTDDEEEGHYPLGFFVRSMSSNDVVAPMVLAARTDNEYVVRAPAGCHVAPSRELLIRHVSVVDDPVRTGTGGAWTFGRLLKQVAATEAQAPELVERVLRSFTERQTINGFEVDSRPLMKSLVLEAWPRTDDGALDLSRSPMRLLAIAHRLDLVDFAKGRVGEGRFVFGVLGRDGGSLLFTLILEYALAGSTEADQREWALAVHALQSAPFPSDAYNDALQHLTERYTARDATPARPNGSALIRLRTNENALGRDGRWEMREFRLSPDTKLLEPAPLEQTPDVSFNGTSSLARFIEANETNVLRETHEVPASLEGAPFQAGALINKLDYWRATGVTSEELRHKFSLNTCDGCHGGETSTSFFHVFPRNTGRPSVLSTFLTGSTERDPATGDDRDYDELARRRRLLEALVCRER
jgi:hypothetical protein